jgi:hypothetical protein
MPPQRAREGPALSVERALGAQILAPGRRRPALAVLFLALAVLSVRAFLRDGARRDTAAAAVERAAPQDAAAFSEALALLETADVAPGFAADAILGDFAPASPSPQGSAQAVSPRLAAARDLALEAMAARPGWIYPRMLLGQAAFGLWAAGDNAGGVGKDAWLKPVSSAAADAPGLDASAAMLADMELNGWQRLTAAERDASIPTLRRALLSPPFVRRSLPLAVRLLPDSALTLLPAEKDSLEAAAGSLRAAGQERLAVEVERRLAALEEAAPPSARVSS